MVEIAQKKSSMVKEEDNQQRKRQKLDHNHNVEIQPVGQSLTMVKKETNKSLKIQMKTSHNIKSEESKTSENLLQSKDEFDPEIENYTVPNSKRLRIAHRIIQKTPSYYHSLPNLESPTPQQKLEVLKIISSNTMPNSLNKFKENHHKRMKPLSAQFQSHQIQLPTNQEMKINDTIKMKFKKKADDIWTVTNVK